VFELSEFQGVAMKKLRGYRVVAQLDNGAVLVARGGKKPEPKIIDVNGREFSFRRYLSNLEKHS
jgi:hypothetical protein